MNRDEYLDSGTYDADMADLEHMRQAEAEEAEAAEATIRQQREWDRQMQAEGLQTDVSDPYDPNQLDDDSDLHEREDWEDRSL